MRFATLEHMNPSKKAVLRGLSVLLVLLSFSSNFAFAFTPQELEEAINFALEQSNSASQRNKANYEVVIDSLLSSLSSIPGAKAPEVVGSLNYSKEKYQNVRRNFRTRAFFTLKGARKSILNTIVASLQDSEKLLSTAGRRQQGDYLYDEDAFQRFVSSTQKVSRIRSENRKAGCSHSAPAILENQQRNSLLSASHAVEMAVRQANKEAQDLDRKSLLEVKAANLLPKEMSHAPAKGKNSYPNLPTDERPTFAAEIAGQPKTLAYYRVRGDGDCGLHGLGVARSQLVERLVEALTTDRPESQEVKDHITQLIHIDTEHPKTRTQEALNNDDLVNYVLEEMSQPSFYIHGESVPLISKLFHLNARVWKKSDRDASRVEMYDLGNMEHNPGGPFMNLFFNGVNHYDLLVDAQDWNARRLAAQRERVWTAMYNAARAQEERATRRLIEELQAKDDTE